MKQIDVTTIIPRDRHPLIFKTFDELKPGEGFVLVNDHDPKPLLLVPARTRRPVRLGISGAGTGTMEGTGYQEIRAGGD